MAIAISGIISVAVIIVAMVMSAVYIVVKCNKKSAAEHFGIFFPIIGAIMLLGESERWQMHGAE